MILFDTNLISEALRDSSDSRVSAWMKSCPATDMWTSTINLVELRMGVAILPDGKRKSALTDNLDRLLVSAFEGRVLPFEVTSAMRFGEIVAGMRRRGRAIGFADGQIAAIASVHGLTVATRDTQPFADAGVPVVNPWVDVQK